MGWDVMQQDKTKQCEGREKWKAKTYANQHE
jgi:hypothetical protein